MLFVFTVSSGYKYGFVAYQKSNGCSNLFTGYLILPKSMLSVFKYYLLNKLRAFSEKNCSK